jgi:hypothetical protein
MDDDLSPEVLDRVRSACLAFPETHEQAAWVGIRWRIRSRTFAHLLVVADGRPQSHARALGREGPVTVLTFRTPPSEVDAFASMGDPYFYGGWGRDVVGLLIDDDTDWDEVKELLTESFRVMAPKTVVARFDATVGP